jgi:hypothetical protein
MKQSSAMDAEMLRWDIDDYAQSARRTRLVRSSARPILVWHQSLNVFRWSGSDPVVKLRSGCDHVLVQNSAESIDSLDPG